VLVSPLSSPAKETQATSQGSQAEGGKLSRGEEKKILSRKHRRGGGTSHKTIENNSVIKTENPSKLDQMKQLMEQLFALLTQTGNKKIFGISTN
jgi:hypothetical protein